MESSKISMKRAKLFEMKPILEGMTHTDGFKFNYAVAKNLRKVKTEIELAQATVEPTREMNEFQKKRLELCRKHALQENGEPAMKGNRFMIAPDKQSVFDEEIKKLQSEYQKDIDLHTNKIDAFNNALNDLVEIEVHKVKVEDVPKNIKPVELEAILDWVVEDEKAQA